MDGTSINLISRFRSFVESLFSLSRQRFLRNLDENDKVAENRDPNRIELNSSTSHMITRCCCTYVTIITVVGCRCLFSIYVRPLPLSTGIGTEAMNKKTKSAQFSLIPCCRLVAGCR